MINEPKQFPGKGSLVRWHKWKINQQAEIIISDLSDNQFITDKHPEYRYTWYNGVGWQIIRKRMKNYPKVAI